ncbi:MAG TPA: protein kinase [Streptosporangiaceae bacterium]|jgi:serine/threonine-protein kinase PknK|nr:protein kinase [Streptosporangiaceae bacterium]
MALRRRAVARAGETDTEVPGYRVLGEAGRGGFSVVYKAHQMALDRVVALKVLNVAHSDERGRDRFLREVGLVIRLSGHPHVVTVLDAGSTRTGRPYIAMDYFELGSLHDRLRERGPLPAAEVAAIGAKIGGALAAAHEAGILHRDIKPQNILVSRFGEPALADFGVALLVSAPGADGRAGTITPYLTPAHAAPEILDGGEPSAAADLYSLGSTLYELLAGRPAYQQDGGGFARLITRVVNDPPPPLTRTDVPEPLRAAVLRAMAKDPAGRFGSAAEFAAALAPLSAEAVPAGTSSRRPELTPVPPGAGETGPAAGLTSSETVLRPGRPPVPSGAEGRDIRPRPGWLGWQAALAAGVAVALAAGGAFVATRHSTLVKAGNHEPVRHKQAGATARPHPAPTRASRPPSAHPTATGTAASGSGAGTAPSAAPPPPPSAAAPQPPSAPQALTVAGTANHAVTLSWSPPASGGGGQVSYDVSWSGAVSGRQPGIGGTSFQVTGLMNNATYTFSVTAVNAAGTSQAATVSQALTPPPQTFNTFRNTQFILNVRSQPTQNSNSVATIPVDTGGGLGPAVTVFCQVTGSAVTDPVDSTLTGDIWDKVSYNGITGYISDLYVNTPQSAAGNYAAFSDPPLWECE